MTSMPQCTPACDHAPLAQYENVRPPPWTLDDAGLTFHYCRKCGALSIQRFNASSGFGQIWMLSPKAMALLTRDAMPSAVIPYLRSEDFFNNRGITAGLFRGFLRHSADLSWPANAVIGILNNSVTPKRDTALIGLLRVVFEEVITRAQTGREARCVITSIEPVIDKFNSQVNPGDDPGEVADARVAALLALEKLGEPALWESLEMHEVSRVEEMIDHMALLDRSRNTLIASRSRIHAEGILAIQAEARFLSEVFRHRDARLPTLLGSVFWACMRDIRHQIQTGRGRSDMMKRTYQQLQLVLEHQLTSMGLERDATLDREDRAFIERRTGIIVRIQRLVPAVSIFRNATAYDPVATFESWHDVTTFISRAIKRGR